MDRNDETDRASDRAAARPNDRERESASERRGDETVTVELPADVGERIERRIAQTRFDSVDDYAATALDLLLRAVERNEQTAPDTNAVAGDVEVETEDRSESGEREDRTSRDRDAVEDQLESLGYL